MIRINRTSEVKQKTVQYRKVIQLMKKQGHYCKVCGRYRANEKFTGKGHATHICKDCAKLPPEEKAKQETLNRLFNLPWYLSKEQKAWLKNRMQDRRPEVKALAQEQYDMRFGRRHQEMQLDDMDEFDEDESVCVG